MTLEEGKSEQYTADQMVAHLVNAEWDDRHNRSIDRHIHNAKFLYKTAIEQVLFDEERSIDQNHIMRLTACDFINRKENILITGSTGIGKSFIASALGHQACLMGLQNHVLQCYKAILPV
jgi:DNA replication protein DnaC